MLFRFARVPLGTCFYNLRDTILPPPPHTTKTQKGLGWYSYGRWDRMGWRGVRLGLFAIRTMFTNKLFFQWLMRMTLRSCGVSVHFIKGKLETFGNCQRPVFPLGVSHYMHITNLWKFVIHWAQMMGACRCLKMASGSWEIMCPYTCSTESTALRLGLKYKPRIGYEMVKYL